MRNYTPVPGALRPPEAPAECIDQGSFALPWSKKGSLAPFARFAVYLLFATLYAQKNERDRQIQSHSPLMEKDGEHVNIHEGFTCGTILTSIVRDGEYRRVRTIHRRSNTWYYNNWQ